MAIVQLRNPTEGRAYVDAKKAAGKTSMEAMPALNRRLYNVVYAQMLADRSGARRRAREGTRGRLCTPARPTGARTSALRICLEI
jgi:hypothetical protein